MDKAKRKEGKREGGEGVVSSKRQFSFYKSLQI